MPKILSKFFFMLFSVVFFLSCEKKIPPQNPEISISEEHGKIINLMINLDQNYSDWNINYDTSSDNYIYSLYYTDYKSKILKSATVRRLEYSNGVLTDISNWNYFEEKTEKHPDWDIHVRWNDSSVTVYKHGEKIKYSLSEAASLKTSKQGLSVPATEITKIDENTYFYQRRKTEKSDYSPFTAWDGDNYIEFDELEGNGRIFDIIRIWNEDKSLCCRFYMNGWMKMDNTYSRDKNLYKTTQYNFSDKELAHGSCYTFTKGYDFFEIGGIKPLLPNEGDKEEEENVYREYDDCGRLIYEQRNHENGMVTVTIVTKSQLDINELSSNCQTPINLETKLIYK